jgi:hypothetical protein
MCKLQTSSPVGAEEIPDNRFNRERVLAGKSEENMGNYGKSTINGGFSSTPSLNTGESQLPAGDLPEPCTGPSVRCQPQHAGFLSPEN